MKGCTKLMYHARQRCMPTRNIGGPASLRFPSPDAPMKSPETGPPEANQASAHLHIDVRGRSTAQATPSSFPGRWLRLSAASVKRQGMLSAGMGVVECLDISKAFDELIDSDFFRGSGIPTPLRPLRCPCLVQLLLRQRLPVKFMLQD